MLVIELQPLIFIVSSTVLPLRKLIGRVLRDDKPSNVNVCTLSESVKKVVSIVCSVLQLVKFTVCKAVHPLQKLVLRLCSLVQPLKSIVSNAVQPLTK